MTEQGRISERFRSGLMPSAAEVDGLVERVADLAVMLSPTGVVEGVSVNPECPSLGSLDHWVQRHFNEFLTLESLEKLRDRMALIESNPAVAQRPLEINHLDNATWEFPIRYTLHPVGQDGSLLLLGRDMQPIAEVQQRLVAEQMARERDQQKIRTSETFYRVVMESSETPMLLVEPEKGRIHDMNAAAASLLGSKPETLNGGSFAQLFEGRKREELVEALQAAASGRERTSVTVTARRNDMVLRLTPEFFRAAGELYVLCQVEPAETSSGVSSGASGSLAGLFAATADSIVITDAKGTVLEANEAFLILTDAAQLRDLKGRSLSDFLVRGTVDLRLILDTAAKAGRMSRYGSQVESVVGNRANVDISVVQLRGHGGEPGFGFIMRDTTPIASAEPDSGMSMVSEDAMKSVMELVGTASLKELVSATSDVIEKMCIETAVRLTGNNRVAAAEMLGLSRQSLYVKLRKHGLIDARADD